MRERATDCTLHTELKTARFEYWKALWPAKCRKGSVHRASICAFYLLFANLTFAQPSSRPTPFIGPIRSEVSELTIPAGTVLRVRLNQSIDTKHSRPGDTFTATLSSPVVHNGGTVIPAGATAYGRVAESKPSGRFKGRAVLVLRLDSVAVRGRRYAVQTALVSRVTTGHKKRNLALIGGGTGLGASIGAIAGGGMGALIGAGAGAGAGTIGEAFTGKKQVRIPVESLLAFRLNRSVAVRI